MSSMFNYRGGDTKEVQFRYSTSYPIERGDLLIVDATTGCVMPATSVGTHSSVPVTQLNVAQYFAGVALEKAGVQSGEVSFRLNQNPRTVRVATAGLFEFDCEAAAFDAGASTTFPVPGDLVGIYCSSTNAPTSAQKVMAADTTDGLARDRAIGVVRPTAASFPEPGVATALAPGESRVLIEIMAGYPYGGPKTMGVNPESNTDASGQ